MNIALLLEMAAEGAGQRVALGSRSGGVTYSELLRLSRNSASWLASQAGHRAGLLDGNSAAVPLLLFGSALAGQAFAPVSYRLAADQLRAVLARLAPAVVIAGRDAPIPDSLPDGLVVCAREQFLDAARRGVVEVPATAAEPDDVAVLLFTSGTTGTPKAAVLRHRQLTAYILGTVEFLGADPGEAALISVPPYHIAGISAILSSVYAGRRIVQLEGFEPSSWLRVITGERITHAMVVPTMLTRIVDALVAGGERVPSLRHLSYGGGRMPLPDNRGSLAPAAACRFRQRLRPDRDKLDDLRAGPADHRKFAASDDPMARRRLGSVGARAARRRDRDTRPGRKGGWPRYVRRGFRPGRAGGRRICRWQPAGR